MGYRMNDHMQNALQMREIHRLKKELDSHKHKEEKLKCKLAELKDELRSNSNALILENEKRELAEKERAQGEDTFLEILQNSPIAVGITDEIGRILFWNSFFHSLGSRQKDDTGRTYFKLNFVKPEILKNLHLRLFDKGSVSDIEVELLDENGITIWAEITMQSIVFEGKISVLTWVYDITERKENERTLKGAKREADEANQAKSSFLATMSHEIRTPMSGVITMTQMLAETSMSKEQRDMLTIIRGSAKSLLTIINDILDFSKIEAGKLDLENVSFSLSQVVESVVDLLALRAEQKGVRLSAFIDPAIQDRLQGDPTRLRQILINLAGNAEKFTEKGDILVTVEARKTQNSTIEVIFKVRDDGIGITDDQKEKLFQPFVQADGSTIRRFGGTGLGLSISRALVEKMGGEIGVDSVVGKGSTFWFRIPFTIKEERRQCRDCDLQETNVLVVSQDPNLSHTFSRYLSFFHANVEIVETSSLALDAIRNHKYQILIADNNLADMANETFTNTIIQKKGNSQLILLQPCSETQVNTVSQDVRVINKPVSCKDLRHIVALAAGLIEEDDNITPKRRNDERGYEFTPPSKKIAKEHGITILVAEDNPTNQTVIRMLLERLGFHADFVWNGLEALRKYKEKDYGLLLTDCHMPEMDGYELVAKIRKCENTSKHRLPIIALSADAISGAKQRCLNVGMDAFLTKPIDRKDLENAILDLLPEAEKWRTRGGNRASRAQVEGLSHSHTKPQRTDDVLHLDYLIHEVLGGDEGMVGPMLEDFLETTQPLLDDVWDALGMRDFNRAKQSAHAAKGAARMTGAIRLANLCETIEHSIMSKDMAHAVTCREALIATFKEVKDAIAKH